MLRLSKAIFKRAKSVCYLEESQPVNDQLLAVQTKLSPFLLSHPINFEHRQWAKFYHRDKFFFQTVSSNENLFYNYKYVFFAPNDNI